MPTEATKPVDNRILYMVIGALAFLLVVAIVSFVVYLCTQKRKARKTRKTTKQGARGQQEVCSSITVGKLHQQGDRTSQQDCFAVSPTELLYSNGMLIAVADGMGGLSDGDKVSETVLSSMFDSFLDYEGRKEDFLLSLAEIANRSVNRLLGSAGIGKSGSTLVAGYIYDHCFYYLSIGDSRICLFRNGKLMQLNREHIYQHDLAIEAVNGRGTLKSAVTHPQKGGLTSYLGMGCLKYIDIPAEPISIQAGDVFVLMSDGVYNALTKEELSSALCLSAEEAAAKIEAMIAAKAYENQDNYTAVVVRCGE